MSAAFHFVNGLDPDRASKKLSRRHVMKGKNTGKRLSRPSKLALQNARTCAKPGLTPARINPVQAFGHFEHGQRDFGVGWVYLSENAAARSLGNMFHTFALPANVTCESLEIFNEFFFHIVDRVYPLRLGLSVHDMKLMWLEILSMDVDAFNGSISLMQACNDLFLGNGDHTPKTLYHLSRTIEIVKRRLGSSEALSISTMAIVISLINQEQMRNHHSAALAHVQGLGKMVALRGGVEEIENEGNALIVLKICKTDIMFALQYGDPVMFFRDGMPQVRDTLSSQGLHLHPIPLSASLRHDQLDSSLEGVLQDIMGVCWLFNQDLRNRTLNVLTFLDIVTSLLYRLLRFRPLNSTAKISSVDATHHLGLILFLLVVFIQRGHRQMIQCRILYSRLRGAVEGNLDGCGDRFAFWFLMVSGIWIADGDSEWLRPKIRAMAVRLELRTWEEALECVGQFPWLNKVFDAFGHELWNEVHRL